MSKIMTNEEAIASELRVVGDFLRAKAVLHRRHAALLKESSRGSDPAWPGEATKWAQAETYLDKAGEWDRNADSIEQGQHRESAEAVQKILAGSQGV